MNQYFDLIRTKLLENLSGYAIAAENENADEISCRLASENEAVELHYEKAKKLYVLYRGSSDDAIGEMSKTQSYLFDESAGDGTREAGSIANDFIGSLVEKPKKSAVAQRRRADKAKDESSAIFFVNRIPTIMPECREPLLLHKEHYEQLLPRLFCEEVVCVALTSALRNGEKVKIRQFCELLSTMYPTCDLDTKSIIMQVILACVPNNQLEYVEGLVSEDLLKAWKHARKWYGKKVKPEKKSAFAKLGDIQATTLKG